jgi:hypothetical protein
MSSLGRSGSGFPPAIESNGSLQGAIVTMIVPANPPSPLRSVFSV